MKNLRDVTLLAVSSIEIPKTILALQTSCQEINFGDIKLISHECPKNLPSNIHFEKCPQINNIMDFNHYVFKNLGHHVDTSHCLMIQYHGFIIHPEIFEDSWLQWDYNGAPWRWMSNSYIYHETGEHIRVGNGGLSMRSKKLLDAPQKLGLSLRQEQGHWNEDGNLTIYHRKAMLEHGIKYAPIEVAAKFSFENHVPENKHIEKTFGFHRRHK